MSDHININSVVSSRDYRPFVQLTWGTEQAQMTPEEARQHAYAILDAANAAETDSIMVGFLKDKVGIPDDKEMIAKILKDFRDLRERKYTAKDGQNVLKK